MEKKQSNGSNSISKYATIHNPSGLQTFVELIVVSKHFSKRLELFVATLDVHLNRNLNFIIFPPPLSQILFPFSNATKKRLEKLYNRAMTINQDLKPSTCSSFRSIPYNKSQKSEFLKRKTNKRKYYKTKTFSEKLNGELLLRKLKSLYQNWENNDISFAAKSIWRCLPIENWIQCNVYH